MTTNIMIIGNELTVDGILVKRGDVMQVQPVGTSTAPPVTPAVLPGMHMMSSYFSSADLQAAVREVKPPFRVVCDFTELLPGPDPIAHYGSTPTGTVNLIGTHPNVSSAPNPSAPGNTGGPFVPGVSTSGAPVPIVEGPDTRVFPPPGPNMDPLYGQANHREYFVHGPAVGLNAAGQDIDAEGRTAGPLPAPANESEVARTIRVGGKHYPGDDNSYDAWGNTLTGSEHMQTLDPVYASLTALKHAAEPTTDPATWYEVSIEVKNSAGAVVWSHPGFGPPDAYLVQPDGRVERQN